MKTTIILLFIPVIFFFSKGLAQNPTPATASKAKTEIKTNGPVAKWDKTAEEMGDIPKGIPRVAEFKLTNEGNEPLLISSAKASCGCTNLNYSKEPLMPGKTTSVNATYNAAVTGPFTKTITVTTNAGEQATVLQIKGNVLEAPAVQK
jgi:hypothetical protein